MLIPHQARPIWTWCQAVLGRGQLDWPQIDLRIEHWLSHFFGLWISPNLGNSGVIWLFFFGLMNASWLSSVLVTSLPASLRKRSRTSVQEETSDVDDNELDSDTDLGPGDLWGHKEEQMTSGSCSQNAVQVIYDIQYDTDSPVMP